MTGVLLRRQLALAAVALLAGLAALAFGEPRDTGRAGVQAVPAADGGWYEARVGSYGTGLYGRATACGVTLEPQTHGVAHPVLPCGAKLFLSFEGREAYTQVVDRGPQGAGREFDVTEALAAELGLRGVEVVEWRFAREED